MKLLNRSKGISVLGILFYALLIIFTVVIGIRLVPVYLDDMAVTDAMKALSTMEGMQHFSTPKLKDAFERKLQTNFMSEMPKDAIKLEKKDDRYELTIAYERRVHLLGNVDAVVVFNHEVPIASN